jgi:hypothetical protein
MLKLHKLHAALPALVLVLLTPLGAEPLSPELKTKVEARLQALKAWGTNPSIVNAVKAYNSAPPADAKVMTNERWRTLTVLDPLVRAYTKNACAEALKANREVAITEAFVSGADGGKVAFLAKTTSWSHKGKDKHQVPMTGATWIGPMEQDESTGAKQVQVSVPVLDGGKPIGSIVVGLGVARL